MKSTENEVMHKTYALKYNNKDDILIEAENRDARREAKKYVYELQATMRQQTLSAGVFFSRLIGYVRVCECVFLCFSDIKILFFLPQNLLHNKFS